jgi:hypothetical protein
VQDTGFSSTIPTGEGLLAFSDLAGAKASIEAVESDYRQHAAAARDIAREQFDAQRVLADMLARIGL